MGRAAGGQCPRLCRATHVGHPQNPQGIVVTREIVNVSIAALGLAACQPNVTPVPEQLESEAAKDEAEANSLLARANGGDGTAPAAAPGGAAEGTHTLGPNSQKLQGGQYYDTLSFQATAGMSYDTQGYRPVFTRTAVGPMPRDSYHLEHEIKPDAGGTWHVLLTVSDPGAGAGGSITVSMQTVTERPLN